MAKLKKNKPSETVQDGINANNKNGSKNGSHPTPVDEKVENNDNEPLLPPTEADHEPDEEFTITPRGIVWDKDVKREREQQHSQQHSREQEQQYPQDQNNFPNADDIPFLTPPNGRTRRREIGETAVRQDEIVLDELIASVPRNQGYYLKLYREKAPNEFELKMRVDNYDSWSDMEWEITSLVRTHTAASPAAAKKWGSGRYRIVIWRDGGVRGQRYKPIDFIVDAQEPESFANGDGGSLREKVSEQLNTLKDLMSVAKAGTPDLEATRKLIADAYNDGASRSGNDSTGTMQMMSTVLSQLISTLNSQANRPTQPPPAPLIDGATLGAIATSITTLITTLITRKQEPKTDPLDVAIKISELMKSSQPQLPTIDVSSRAIELLGALMPIAEKLGGGASESGSVMSEVIRTIGPSIGPMIKDVTQTINNVVQSRSNPSIQMPYIIPQPAALPPTQQADSPNQQPNLQPEQVMPATIFGEIERRARANDVSFFPTMSDIITRVVSPEDFRALLENKADPMVALEAVSKWGGPFFTSPIAVGYFNSYLAWERQHQSSVSSMSPPNEQSASASAPATQSPMLIAACSNCSIEYEFINERDLTENSRCPSCGTQLMKSSQSSQVVSEVVK